MMISTININGGDEPIDGAKYFADSDRESLIATYVTAAEMIVPATHLLGNFNNLLIKQTRRGCKGKGCCVWRL